jgi:hypothetical protein
MPCAVLLLVGACASEERWVKDNGEAADPQVVSECSRYAWGQAHYSQMSNPAFPFQVLVQDKSERPGSIRSHAEMQEQTLFDLCMRKKGYDLVPAKAEQPR